jgi:hypothetical protein
MIIALHYTFLSADERFAGIVVLVPNRLSLSRTAMQLGFGLCRLSIIMEMFIFPSRRCAVSRETRFLVLDSPIWSLKIVWHS